MGTFKGIQKRKWEAKKLFRNWIIVDEKDNILNIRDNRTNAKLVAAAPELLEALNAITDNIETWLNTGVAADKNISEELYNNAVSAIKKATK